MAAPKESTVTVSEWVARLGGLIKKQQAGIFEIGDALVEMKTQLSKKDFATVIDQTRITKDYADSLMRVANKTILRRPDIQKHLPISRRAVIKLAAWPDAKIIKARDDSELNPRATIETLKEYEELRAEPADAGLIELTSTSIPRDNAEPSLFGYFNHDDWTEDEINEAIELATTAISKKFGKQINFTTSRAAARKLHLKARKHLPCIASPSLAEQEISEEIVCDNETESSV
jgi:hypothetical protein